MVAWLRPWPSESRGPPSPDYFSPCLRLRSSMALPPPPSLRGAVSLRPSQRVAQPREGERREGGTGRGQVIQGQVEEDD